MSTVIMAASSLAAASEFALFPLLPKELRRAIWKECLPRRVMELDSPYHEIIGTYCQLQSTSRLNMRPPIITRVCHESRDVAFEKASILPYDSNAPKYLEMGYSTIAHHWFCPSTDIVHLNWTVVYNPTFDFEGDPIPHFLWHAAKGTTTPSIAASIVQGLDEEPLYTYYDEDFVLLEARKDYLITLQIVSLHVSMEQALRTELFGRLAEERVKLVDVFEKETIQKYHQLWASGPQDDQEPAKAFQLLLSTDILKNKIDKWKKQVDDQWLSHKVDEAKTTNPAVVGELGNIWIIELDEDEEFDDDGWHPPPRSPNFQNPWVKKVLEERPRFAPMVMFRFCEKKCYIPAAGRQSNSL